MKAISLWQPWASLVAIGAKKIETRSWPTKYRGPLAIHASKKDPRKWMNPVDDDYDFVLAAEKALNGAIFSELPRGCVIAIADLVDCVKMIGVVNGSMGPIVVPVYKAELENGETVRGNEFKFGLYEIGRYAWILENVRRIDPVPATGRQGLWNWEPPPGLTSPSP